MKKGGGVKDHYWLVIARGPFVGEPGSKTKCSVLCMEVAVRLW